MGPTASLWRAHRRPLERLGRTGCLMYAPTNSGLRLVPGRSARASPRPHIASFELLDRSRRLFVFQNVVFTQILAKPIEFDEFPLSRGSQNEPRGTQERPKSLSRASFFPLRFWLRFLIDFGPILAPKRGPQGPPFGSQDGSKIDQKFEPTSECK